MACPGAQAGGKKRKPITMNPDFETDEYVDPDEQQVQAGHDEMDALMDQYLDRMAEPVRTTGQLIKVPIVAFHEKHAAVDVGDKAEGIIDIAELKDETGQLRYKQGDVIEAIIKGHDEETGNIILSHAEARRRVAFDAVKASLETGKTITGRVVRVVKGGLIVDIGTTAFLPASQIDRRRIENFEEWVGQTVECVVIEFAPEKRRIILSRRKVVEAAEAQQRAEMMSRLQVGQIVEGTVKRIVEFGVFVDFNGVDALIPRSEISWHRMARAEDYLKPGETIRVKIIDVEPTTGKVTLSRRKLEPDPWDSAAERYPVGTQVEGEVVSITSYGAFVRLAEGLDGMVHISDMAWDSGGKQPGSYVAIGQKLGVQVLNVDAAQKRISLGLKQLVADPWSALEVDYPPMTRFKGKVTGLTKYGAFVELVPGIEGMVHVSDFSWDQKVQHPRDKVAKGDEIEVCVLKIDTAQRRISLGIKQLSESPIMQYSRAHRVNEVVEGEIQSLTEFGAFIALAEGVEGFIHVSQLDKGRVESPAKSFKVGEKLQAEITKIDLHAGKVNLSRRQLLKREEKQTIATYMNKRSSKGGGTNLGELLSELPLDEDLTKSS